MSSEESALKYFLLGAFAAGFIVYGVALVFGATGSTALSQITAAINAGDANLVFLTVGAALILVGFGFKVAAVPFHVWTPDVYQGASNETTSLVASLPKVGAVAVLVRFVSRSAISFHARRPSFNANERRSSSRALSSARRHRA